MADYLSKYTGQQVDAAVQIALDLTTTLDSYIKKTDINISVPGLSDGLINSTQLPKATKTTLGILQVGDNLIISPDSVLSVDFSDYYNCETVDQRLSQKVDQQEFDKLIENFEGFNNYVISIVRSSVQDPNSAEVYYQLTIN